MKKIFIYSYNLELGGIERSLIGLLENINPNECEVDLFLAKHEGELMHCIPSYVNLLSMDKKYRSCGVFLKQAIKNGDFQEVVYRLFCRYYNTIKKKLTGRKKLAVHGFMYHKFMINRMKPQNKEYDLAVSFSVPFFYVLNKVVAKEKIGFIHTDYTKVDIDVPFVRKMFSDIDYIACVSDSVRNCFLKTFFEYREKTIIVENIISVNEVMHSAQLSYSGMEEETDIIKILTVGRFGKAKNFENIPEICSMLISKGLNVKWYLIGFGDSEKVIRANIDYFGVQDKVIILGKKDNPYPYMKFCDLYVQPSRFEGKAVTVREAQILGKPVVITDFPTAKSQLEDGVDGIIVPLDNEGCAEGIASLLQNKEKMRMLSDNCKKRDYSNKSELDKLLNLI